MKNRKAPGSDDMQTEMLKVGRDALVSSLTEIRLFMAGCYPKDWAQGIIIPIFEAGDKDQPANYRGITITSAMDKLYAMTLCQRLSKWAETHNLRAPSQAGFRQDYRASDQLFILRTLFESCRAKNESLYCAMLDHSKAFDKIPRALLWRRLQILGIHGNMMRAIQAVHASVQVCVRTPSGDTDYFPSNVGVKQGCPLSPLLFRLYIDALHDKLCKPSVDAPLLRDSMVPLLMFADDSKLLSRSPQGL